MPKKALNAIFVSMVHTGHEENGNFERDIVNKRRRAFIGTIYTRNRILFPNPDKSSASWPRERREKKGEQI